MQKPERTSLRIIDPGDIIHAPCNNKHTVRRPSQIVDFRSGRATHVLHTPGFLIVRSILSEPRLRLQFRRHPKQDIPVVSSRCQHLAYIKMSIRPLSPHWKELFLPVSTELWLYTFRTKPDDIDGLSVLHKRTQVNNLAFLLCRFHSP